AAEGGGVERGRPIQAEAPARLIAVVAEPRIRQVLANLLANVREHTPARTPVAVRLAPAPGGVVLEVADAGPGMPQQDAARAFDRFHRGGDRADSRVDTLMNGSNGGGSGLGLSIVQAIAAAHGGPAPPRAWPSPPACPAPAGRPPLASGRPPPPGPAGPSPPRRSPPPPPPPPGP